MWWLCIPFRIVFASSGSTQVHVYLRLTIICCAVFEKPTPPLALPEKAVENTDYSQSDLVNHKHEVILSLHNVH